MTEWRTVERPSTLSVQPRAQVVGDIPDAHVITVRERRVTVDYPTIIQNNVNTDVIELDLDGEWDNMSVVLVLGPCGGATELAWHGEPVTLPSALAEDTGGIDVSVVGYSADGETRLVTVAAPSLLSVIKSGCTVGEAPAEETPDLIGQLVAAGDAANKAAQAANTAAEEANGAAGAARTAASAANTAAGKASTAATEATNAASAATDAAGEATRAAQSANAAAEAASAAAEAARGNVLKGTLGPEPMLSADDAYATKPRKLTVSGETRQNLWRNPPTKTKNGITLTSNADGSITIDGTASRASYFYAEVYCLKPGASYTLSLDRSVKASISVQSFGDSEYIADSVFVAEGSTSAVGTVRQEATKFRLMVQMNAGTTNDNVTVRVMLNEGSTAQPWCPPGLNSVGELAIVVSTTDNAEDGTTTPIDLDGHALNSLPDGTRDELHIDGGGNVVLEKRVGAATFDGSEDEKWTYTGNRIGLIRGAPGSVSLTESNNGRCDTLPVRDVSLSPAIMVYGGNDWVNIRNDAAITDAESGKAWLAANHTTILYPLREPQTISLPSVTLPTLPAPTVNVWADAEASGAGYAMDPDVELEYERDVTIAFNKLQAQISATTVREATNG